MPGSTAAFVRARRAFEQRVDLPAGRAQAALLRPAQAELLPVSSITPCNVSGGRRLELREVLARGRRCHWRCHRRIGRRRRSAAAITSGIPSEGVSAPARVPLCCLCLPADALWDQSNKFSDKHGPYFERALRGVAGEGLGAIVRLCHIVAIAMGMPDFLSKS